MPSLESLNLHPLIRIKNATRASLSLISKAKQIVLIGFG
jgi:hypothetical protein